MERAPPTSPSPGETPDLNVRILRAPVLWVVDTHGREALEELAERSGLSADILLKRRSHWIALERFEAFLEGLRELAGSDETFLEACAHRMNEGYGPFRYLLWALPPERLYRQLARTMHSVCRHAHYEVLAARRDSVRLRYVTTGPESRLACLSRQAQITMAPTWSGLPPARLTERACVAEGDDFCEYELRFYVAFRAFPPLAGAGLGGALGVALHLGGAAWLPAWLVAPLLGGLVGFALEARRTNRANLRLAEEMREALSEVAREEAEAQRELRQTTDTLAKREALAAVGEFASALAHELRNPLTSIQVDLQRVEEVSEDGAARRALTDRLLEAVRRLDRTVAGVLRVAASGRLEPRPIDLEGPLSAAMAGARPIVQARDAQLEIAGSADGSVWVLGDAAALEQLFLNLLVNAAEALPEGGAGRVEVTVARELDPEQAPSDGEPGWAEVRIRDTGEGMPPQVQERVFEPLFSTKQGGTGLGMAIALKIARAHGGEILLDSETGRGTTATVQIPLALTEPDAT